MQPLISPVDHESRRTAHHGDDESEIRPSEETPLINRFPNIHRRQRNLVTVITVGLLLTILLAGVIIGIYLLILQSNSENILPPIDDTLQVLTIPQWSGESLQDYIEAATVVVMQTDTRQCGNETDCLELIKETQVVGGNSTLPYNFMVSSKGLMFEALGWKRSPHPQMSALVVAFIGNFTEAGPPQPQIDAFNNLLANSVNRHYLAPTYNIIGSSRKYTPKKLFERLSYLPQWNNELSDIDN